MASLEDFSSLHGALVDLYRAAAAGSGTAGIAAGLRPLRARVVERADPVLRETYERYLRLIALRLGTTLPADLAFGAAAENAALAGRTIPAPSSGPPSGPAPLRLLVSGIGRSGTTLLYQQLAKLLLLDRERVNFRYEPYLWNIRTPKAAGNPFDMAQLHRDGIRAHLETPLFLAGPHSLHDAFLDTLFDGASDDDPSFRPDACLTKVIRGSGRLESYLARYPDLKIVACLRNPYDTINSSLGMFSFFGEEFHADDRPRFAREVAGRDGGDAQLPVQAPRAIAWFAAWWRAFTAETLAVARRHPENVFPFCYEQYRRDGPVLLDALQDFVGVANPGIGIGLEQPAGPTIRATSLTRADFAALDGAQTFYEEAVLEPLLGGPAIGRLRAKLADRYERRDFSYPVAGADPGRSAPIRLRGMLLHGHSSPFLRLVRDRHPIDLDTLVDRHATGAQRAVRRPERDPGELKRGRRFGAVVICHDNASTIGDAVLSCLDQTLPFDEIVVVDDKSTDGSRERIGVVAEMYAQITPVFLGASLGPAAARDAGIRRLTTDFWTQLDGDDLFWPAKNAGEARVLAGDPASVAFSDILLVRPGQSSIQNTAAYDDGTASQTFDRLLARTSQIPRDMTMSREAYLASGGYDLLGRLYEDWDFKLRLAARCDLRWRRSDSVAGTIYNRLAPGLSAAPPETHARALVLIFLRALALRDIACADILPAYDAALAAFADDPLVGGVRDWLGRAVGTDGFDVAAFGRMAGGRRMQTMGRAGLGALFADLRVPLRRIETIA